MQNLMPPVDTPDKAFHDGNPLTGELGTIVTAKFMNDVQAAIRNSQTEIISVLTDAGIAIDQNKTDQLLTALKATFATNSNMNGRVPSSRTVNGKALSADITLNAGDVGALSAAGTAVAATKLATARNINGVQFDGTTNITLSASGVGALSRSENGADIQDKSAFARNAQVPHLGGTWIEFGGSSGGWTTSQFVSFLSTQGAFEHLYFVCAGTWNFSANKKITDTGCGHIELAGAVIEVFSSRFNLNTIRITTMSASSDPLAVQGQFVYVESETPGSGEWRREFNTKNLTAADINAIQVNEFVGIPQPWPLVTVPVGWLACAGQSFDTSLYPILASRYPSGVLPELRGEFLRGLDSGRGVDPGRVNGSAQGPAMESHTHSGGSLEVGSGAPLYAGKGLQDGTGILYSRTGVNNNAGTETRPRNVAFNYIVRAA
ncbi:tail fiber protein [Pectobacterium brasiliense]|uniref:phage tail protein n=1 Tax=Pectobacterium brasiliense TaxID=180957 RepID=UPI00196931E8|nr:phage tail protein [Pectobacterium brasiliense]MBN3254279.1 tail fiber protein [Pectobacterium brasiliense]